MSKTDKTRPFWVKVLDNPSRYKEEHDHRNGVCDLPDTPTLENIGWPFGSMNGCRWTYTTEFINSGEAQCCCNTCRGWYWNDWRNTRRQRRVAKRELRNELKVVNARD